VEGCSIHVTRRPEMTGVNKGVNVPIIRRSDTLKVYWVGTWNLDRVGGIKCGNRGGSTGER